MLPTRLRSPAEKTRAKACLKRAFRLAFCNNSDPCETEERNRAFTMNILVVDDESDNYTAIQNLEELGFKNGKDFFVVARLFSVFDGGFV